MIRQLLPVLLNQSSAVILGLVGVKLISQYVPKETNGDYVLFVTLTQLGCLVTHPGILSHAMRYWQREAGAARTYVRFLWDQTIQRLVVLAILLGIACSIRAFQEHDLVWLWLLLPFGLLSNFALVLQAIGVGVLTAEKRLWHVLWINLLAAGARICLPVGIALAVGMTFPALSFGFAVHGAIVVALVLGWFRFAWGAAPPSSEIAETWRRELREYGRPFLWLGVGSWLFLYADRFIVESFFGKSQSGLFGYAANIGAMIPFLVSGGLMQLVFPRIFRQSDEARSASDWQRIARYCDAATLAFVLLTVAGLLLFAQVGPFLVGPLIDPKYSVSVAMVLPAGFATAALQINQFYGLLLQGRHNSAALVKVTLLISALKTAGSIVAASISWEAFLNWLIVSFLASGLVGGLLLRRAARTTPT